MESKNIVPEEKRVLELLIDGYNNFRHNQGWPMVSVVDLLYWEEWKANFCDKPKKKPLEDKNGESIRKRSTLAK